MKAALLALLVCCCSKFFVVESAQSFPKDFLFGAATSAYQIEGAYNADGKGVSYWDFITNNVSSTIADGSNGNVACDSYNLYKEDVKLLSNLGVNYYRFSISWTRILPNGDAPEGINSVNPAGVAYYNNLINELVARDITPMVTLYHWDIPMKLHKKRGFLDPKTLQKFKIYCDLVFQLFGDRVKYWLTINEPNIACYLDRGPKSNQTSELYQCEKNILLAHASVYRLYEKRYKASQGGKLSMALDVKWYEPASNKREDRLAATRFLDFTFGKYVHPILLGDFPINLKKYAGEKLPSLSKSEQKLIKGTFDFVGVNFYTSKMIRSNETNIDEGYEGDAKVTTYIPESWSSITPPEFFRSLLKFIKNEYKNPEIIITETGYGDFSTEQNLNDTTRINYFQTHLIELSKSIRLNKVRVKAYTAWSLMDNFEWIAGYTEKYGLHHVDFNSSTKTRTPRASATFYKNVISSKQVPEIDN